MQKPHKTTNRLLPGHPFYPFPAGAGLPRPEFVDILGDPALLRRRKIGLICSRQCPGAIILKALDRMMELRDQDLAVASGFQSPLEAACLKLLLGGSCGIIVCPARSLSGMGTPKELCQALEAGRLLFLSTFAPTVPRPRRRTTAVRNRLVADLCYEILVPHAAPGGSVEALARELQQDGRRITDL